MAWHYTVVVQLPPKSLCDLLREPNTRWVFSHERDGRYGTLEWLAKANGQWEAFGLSWRAPKPLVLTRYEYTDLVGLTRWRLP